MIGERGRGRKHTPETRKKISLTKFLNGTNKHSEETRKKMSIARKGKPLSETQLKATLASNARRRKPIYEYDQKGNVVNTFSSFYDVLEDIRFSHLNRISIMNACRLEITCNGVILRYKK